MMDMNREWGGYLPLELTLDYCSKGGLFDLYNDKVIYLNSARNAISYIAKNCQYEKIWIPLYMCASIAEALERFGINYGVYNIGEDFRPRDVHPGANEIIMICNYFGIQDDSFYDWCLRNYENIIFDNTQAMFQKPIMRGNVFNVYSPRKFVGVSDGAMIVTDSEKLRSIAVREPLSTDYSYDRCGFLIEAMEKTTNGAYVDHLKSEDSLDDDIKCMSKFTKRVLSCIDFDRVGDIRLKNFNVLRDKLDTYNELEICEIKKSPMCYPLFFRNEGLRSRLVDNKIYVPQWWKWVLEDERSTKWERELSKWILPIAIDQRYNEDDINELADRIIQLI